MAEPFRSPDWRVWVQPGGPNTDMELVGCADTDDLEEGGSGIKDVIRCFRADGSGWDVLATTRNPPDPISVTITDLVETTASWLELLKEQGCPFPLYFNGRTCPPHDVFPGAARTYAIQQAEVGSLTLSGLAMREEDEITTRAAEITGWPPVIAYRAMAGTRRTIAEYSDLTDIAFCNVKKCDDDCGPMLAPCTYGVTVSIAPAGSPAVTGDVYITEDGGNTWTATAADPFGNGEDVESVVCFPVSDTVTRILVVREPIIATPGQVSYSDDDGANWTDVNLPYNNWGPLWQGTGFFALDYYHIWLCGANGIVLFSENGGETWTAQYVGAVTNLYDVYFVNDQIGMAVGLNGAVYRTFDGGETWAAATVPVATTLLRVCENKGGGIWWVGTTTGDLYYSTDFGTTWAQRAFAGDGAGDINDIQFVNQLAGFMLYELTVGPTARLYRTRNGGRDWEQIAIPTTRGMNAIWACTQNHVFAVGDVQGTTAMLIEASG